MSNWKQIKILAIETSADETSAAVLRGDRVSKKFKILSNVIHSQIPTHQKTGGIVPEVAARAHIPKILPVVKLALRQGKANLQEIDYLAVTAGPGLVTSLRIGVDTAKALAFALKKPIIPVNHMEGHLLSALGNSPLLPLFNPRGGRGKFFPALGLVVSGGHTMLVLVKDFGKYQILGETLDDAAGECFDKVAKILRLSYPGGPEIARLAKQGNPKAFDFPRPMLNQKSYNFSFAGLKTYVLYLWREKLKAYGLKLTALKRDIAACTEQAIIDTLVVKTIRAAKEFKVKTILLGGGVAANKKLRTTLKKEIRNNLNSKFYIPDSGLTTDNAGMIALSAFYHYLYGNLTSYSKVKANPNWELTSWR